MKMKRISRVFLAFLLASGIQLSLSTCTNSGEMIPTEETTDNDEIYMANDEIDYDEEISNSHVKGL